MKDKVIKKRLIRVLSFVLTFVCSFCLLERCGGNGVCLAIADIPNGTVSGTTYYVNDVITNWNQLEGLLGDYNTINLTKAKIRDNDFSHFVHLGDESNTEFISKIICSRPAELYPQMILPAFDTTTKTFLACHDVRNTSNPTMIIAYKWENTMSYVYDSSRSNKITVNHDIRDENGLIMLPYAKVLEKIDEVDAKKNTVSITGINSPDRSGDEMKIVYDAVLNGYTSLDGMRMSRFTATMGYYYHINTRFNSAVKSDIDVMVLGGVNILARDEAGDAVSGVKFKIYNDEACTEPAKRYDGSTWVEIDTLQSGADGSAVATNLKPGKYYVKEVESASGYETNDSVEKVIVAGKTIDTGLDSSSGEGNSIDIYKEDVVLDPEWEMDTRKQNATFKNNANNIETVNAADYNDGGETFVRAGGSALAFESAEDVAALDGMSKLNSEKCQVEVGSICESFDNPSEALDYVNTSLITGALLDDESARDHVTISGSNLMYYDQDSCVTVNFAETEVQDVPPTGIERVMFAVHMLALALAACFCRILI